VKLIPDASQILVEYLFPKPGKWVDLQDGLRALNGPGYILAHTERPRLAVNSGIFGGGISRKRYFLKPPGR
jgi:hypothetical protein